MAGVGLTGGGGLGGGGAILGGVNVGLHGVEDVAADAALAGVVRVAHTSNVARATRVCKSD